jgi:hypothetical protein
MGWAVGGDHRSPASPLTLLDWPIFCRRCMQQLECVAPACNGGKGPLSRGPPGCRPLAAAAGGAAAGAVASPCKGPRSAGGSRPCGGTPSHSGPTAAPGPATTSGAPHCNFYSASPLLAPPAAPCPPAASPAGSCAHAPRGARARVHSPGRPPRRAGRRRRVTCDAMTSSGTTEQPPTPLSGAAGTLEGTENSGPARRTPSLRHRCLRVLEACVDTGDAPPPRRGRSRWPRLRGSRAVSMAMAAGVVLALILLGGAKQTDDGIVRCASREAGGRGDGGAARFARPSAARAPPVPLAFACRRAAPRRARRAAAGRCTRIRGQAATARWRGRTARARPVAGPAAAGGRPRRTPRVRGVPR